MAARKKRSRVWLERAVIAVLVLCIGAELVYWFRHRAVPGADVSAPEWVEQDILPLNVSWAILLTNFIEALKPYTGKEIRPEEWSAINAQAVAATRKIYRKAEYAQIEGDLQAMLDCLCTVARGGTPTLTIQPMQLAAYASRMVGPHRMDLMVSSMVKDGAWHCNQKCLHCYAANQPLSAVPELDTEGRLITLEYPGFFLVTCYTPNAQEGLKRLDHRLAWDLSLIHI